MNRVPLNRFAPLSALALVCAVAAPGGMRSAIADDSTPPPVAPETEAPNPAPSEPTAPPPVGDEVTAAPESPEPTSSPESEAKAETPPVATPTEAAPATPPSEAQTETLVAARRQKYTPYYQTTHPSWGFEFTLSALALGGQDIEVSQAGSLTRAFETQIEYQFPFLQQLGVLSAGPSIVIYPITPLATVTSNAFSIWSAGGEIRYQARLFREQPLVPMGGFEYQRMTYHFASDGVTGATGISGPFVGVMFLLNFIEPSAAAEMYVEQGISRSYLLAEYKSMSGGDGTVNVSGSSFFFGLRLEF